LHGHDLQQFSCCQRVSVRVIGNKNQARVGQQRPGGGQVVADMPTETFNTLRTTLQLTSHIDPEFVTSAKKFANFNEFSEIKKIRKNSYKNSLNARV